MNIGDKTKTTEKPEGQPDPLPRVITINTPEKVDNWPIPVRTGAPVKTPVKQPEKVPA